MESSTQAGEKWCTVTKYLVTFIKYYEIDAKDVDDALERVDVDGKYLSQDTYVDEWKTNE